MPPDFVPVVTVHSVVTIMTERRESINLVLSEIADSVALNRPQSITSAVLRYTADDLGALIQCGMVQLVRIDPSGPLLVMPSADGWRAAEDYRSQPGKGRTCPPQPGEIP